MPQKLMLLNSETSWKHGMRVHNALDPVERLGALFFVKQASSQLFRHLVFAVCLESPDSLALRNMCQEFRSRLASHRILREQRGREFATCKVCEWRGRPADDLDPCIVSHCLAAMLASHPEHRVKA